MTTCYQTLQVRFSFPAANDVQVERSTPTCLELRSMSADTSGARCQGKLTYPAMSTPHPPHTSTATRNLSSDPRGTREAERLEVIMKLLAEK